MAFPKTFSIAQDTANGKVDEWTLIRAFQDSAVKVAFDYLEVNGDVLTTHWKAQWDQEDEDEMYRVVGAHTGAPSTRRNRTPDGKVIVVPDAAEDYDTPTIISPDWTDPTTWYSTAAWETGVVLTDTGDGLTFQSPHTNWIDLRGGKLTQGHQIWPEYQFDVKVDGVSQPVNDLNGNGGVCTVDAAAGTVTFSSPPGGQVTADYSRMVDSTWIVAPEPGKKLTIRAVEVQFSSDVVLTTAAVFAPYGLVEVFAPQMAVSGGGQIPDGTKIALKERRYERMYNYIDEAQRAYPTIPPLGGPGWRGFTKDVHVFRWPYVDGYGSPITLYSSMGMELRIYLEGHVPFQGERATVTLYARSQDE